MKIFVVTLVFMLVLTLIIEVGVRRVVEGWILRKQDKERLQEQKDEKSELVTLEVKKLKKVKRERKAEADDKA